MNKTLALPFLVIASVVVWFASTSTPHARIAGDAPSKEEAHGFQSFQIPHGRVLYVVIDSDGAYLGDQRIERRFAKDAINALLRKEKIRNLVIYGTDLARYGDVIELYAGIDPSLIRWSSFSFKAVPIGTRKPLTGYLKSRFGYAEDIENKSDDE